MSSLRSENLTVTYCALILRLFVLILLPDADMSYHIIKNAKATLLALISFIFTLSAIIYNAMNQETIKYLCLLLLNISNRSAVRVFDSLAAIVGQCRRRLALHRFKSIHAMDDFQRPG